MKQDEPKFTVFARQERGLLSFFHSGVFGRPTDLTEFIASVANRRVLDSIYTPIAWCGGHSHCCDPAESIAAGGVIDFIDGKYVPRGVPVEDAAVWSTGIGRVMHKTLLRSAKVIHEGKLAERERPALTWATKTERDAFPGFSVTSATHSESSAAVHPLQLMSDNSNPLHGSAYLQRKAG